MDSGDGPSGCGQGIDPRCGLRSGCEDDGVGSMACLRNYVPLIMRAYIAVVVSDVEIDSEYQFERRKFSSNPEQLRSLAAWLLEQEAEEIVMESTAQYWKPVWEALERYWKPICEQRTTRTQEGFPRC